jgi:PAS domain S-box-containing protein
MAKALEPPDETENLRLRAERIAAAVASGSRVELEALAPDGFGLLLHELLVHKLELEMQNEELRRAQAELDAQRARYFDLYDLAPVGYCSISEQGLVLEANLTAAALLRTPRSTLVSKPFTRFVLNEDQDVYYRFRKRLLETGQAQACDLRMVKEDRTMFWGVLSATVARDGDGAQVCRITIEDMSRQKRAEEDLRRSVEEKEALLRELRQRG